MKIDRLLKMFIAFIPFIIGLMFCIDNINYYECMINAISSSESCGKTHGLLSAINNSMMMRGTYSLTIVVLQFLMCVAGLFGIKNIISSFKQSSCVFYSSMKYSRISCLLGIVIFGLLFFDMNYGLMSKMHFGKDFFPKFNIDTILMILISYVVLHTEEVEC